MPWHKAHKLTQKIEDYYPLVRENIPKEGAPPRLFGLQVLLEQLPATLRAMSQIDEVQHNRLAALTGELSEANAGLRKEVAASAQANRRLGAEHAVPRILAKAIRLSDAATKILQAVSRSLGWDVGALWTLDRDAEVLRCMEIWHAPKVDIPAFEQVSRQRTFLAGMGLPGHVWASDCSGYEGAGGFFTKSRHLGNSSPSLGGRQAWAMWPGIVFSPIWRSVMKQYSSLALLIVIFLVVPQPMVRAQGNKQEQERAIAEIKKLGGSVEVDTKSPDRRVIGVNLKHTKIVDASLEHLKGLTSLQRLYLKDTAVTDDALVYVKGLTNLEVLELGRTKVTDNGLGYLKGFTNLQRLDLGGTQITDKGISQLKGATKLETLSLEGTEVTDVGLEQLKGLSGLATLNLENAKGISDKGLMHLKGLTNLRKLNLHGTKITDAGIRDLQKALPNVKIIH